MLKFDDEFSELLYAYNYTIHNTPTYFKNNSSSTVDYFVYYSAGVITLDNFVVTPAHSRPAPTPSTSSTISLPAHSRPFSSIQAPSRLSLPTSYTPAHSRLTLPTFASNDSSIIISYINSTTNESVSSPITDPVCCCNGAIDEGKSSVCSIYYR